MWAIAGKAVAADVLGALTPDRVLLEYDGPRVFTTHNAADQTMLAYACGEDENVTRYLLVPLSSGVLSALEGGRITIRDALCQSWAWIAERDHAGQVVGAWAVDVESLPPDALPRPGVPLYARHVELLRVRMIGEGLRAGAVPASVVVRAVNGAVFALKHLIQYVEDTAQSSTRPHEWVRALYNLPIHRFSYNSFEVAFASPPQASLPATPGHDALDRAGEVLRSALEWANAAEERPVRRDNPDDRAIVAALEQLVPPKQGIVYEVEVAGRLVGPKAEGVRLTRTASERVRRAVNALDRDLRPQTLFGKVREFDKDRLSFTLRWGDGAAANTSQRCEFSETLYEKVSEAFDRSEETWFVLGYAPLPGKPFRVLDLGPHNGDEGEGQTSAAADTAMDSSPQGVGGA